MTLPLRHLIGYPHVRDRHGGATGSGVRAHPAPLRRTRPEHFAAGFEAIQDWITQAGHTATGALRELYLDCDGPRDTWVTELQTVIAD